MDCQFSSQCGGCSCREMEIEAYRMLKLKQFRAVLSKINQPDIKTGEPVFINDGTRRRASLGFCYRKGSLQLGFNQAKSNILLDIPFCPLLTPGLNQIFPALRRLIASVCEHPYQIKKGKKIISQTINKGDIWLTETANGIDMVLEIDAPLELAHRMVIFEQAQEIAPLIRISHRHKPGDSLELLIEKNKPFIKIGGYSIYIPAGTFLQPSVEGEQALTGLVKKYLGSSVGKIADLFCGVGTFSYVLAADINNKILAVDSSPALLEGFRESVNRNMIPNIQILSRNLFKYPLDAADLKNFEAVVFDPPRAGAAAQARQLAALSQEQKPSKIIAVSCNPNTFINDANTLLDGGYRLEEVTLVDQFIYSNHSELVALFTKA